MFGVWGKDGVEEEMVNVLMLLWTMLGEEYKILYVVVGTHVPYCLRNSGEEMDEKMQRGSG